MKWNAEDEVCYHYTIERFLGAGGMGEVYHAFHKVTRREVAIKAIREHWKDQSEYPMMHDRFSKEATIWTRLPRSPNIVEAIEFFPDFQSDPYLILEFIDGVNLKAFLEREKRIDCLQAIRYAMDFCTGMEAAILEGRPIIHRDVSHDNVLISKAGNTLKVNDFGLAMTGVLNPNSQFYVMGKEYFMSPEQRLAYSPEQRAALDVRADIYSFGLTFRWAIFGCPEGVERPTLGPRGQALADFFKQCIEPDREDRPPTFTEIRHRLGELLEQYAGDSRMLCRECGFIPLVARDRCSLCGGALHESVPVTGSVVPQDPEFSQLGARKPDHIPAGEDPTIPQPLKVPTAETFVQPGFLALAGGSSETGISEATVNLICSSLGIDERRVRHLKESSPQRFVDLEPFAVARHTVTRAEFRDFVEATDYDRRTGLPFERSPGCDDHPVTGVSWDDAMAYCRWRGDVRLPTVFEWEHAARGGRVQLYPWGNDFDPARCNTEQSDEGRIIPVDRYPESASPCGALQMTGNVWELTDSGSKRHGKIAIGGSFRSDGRWQGATFFNYYVPNNDRDSDDVGFRVASAPAAAAPDVHGTWIQIPAGEFWSGCEQVFAETLVRKFGLSGGSIGKLTQYEHAKRALPAYEICAHPVTNAQYLKFMLETEHRIPEGWQEGNDEPFPADLALHPVTGVSVDDARQYCRWACGRLPRAEEYERACRGQGGRYYPFGNTFDNLQCNTAEANRGRTTPVFEFKGGRSAEGIWDLCGNVAEWVDELKHGGCATMGGSHQQSCEIYGLPFFRVFRDGGEYHDDVGFRCVRD